MGMVTSTLGPVTSERSYVRAGEDELKAAIFFRGDKYIVRDFETLCCPLLPSPRSPPTHESIRFVYMWQ